MPVGLTVTTMVRRTFPLVTVLLVAAAGCSSGASSDDSLFPVLSTVTPPTVSTTVPAVPTTAKEATPVTSPTTTVALRASASTFVLSSPDIQSGGTMPVAFTCDGQSLSPSLSWTNGPTGTKGYAIAMHHVPGPGDTHWYWVVYDIPLSVHSVAAGGPAPGSVGTNSVNNQLAYAPPCSKGPGPKLYTITVYALSKSPGFAPGSAVSRDQLLAAIKDITLAESAIDVTYSRS